jgi:hypothetical protein
MERPPSGLNKKQQTEFSVQDLRKGPDRSLVGYRSQKLKNVPPGSS